MSQPSQTPSTPSTPQTPSTPPLPPHDILNFDQGIVFSRSNCDIDGVGHDIKHAMVAYDFNGVLARICPRPWCMKVISTTPVDDLTSDEYDELMQILASLMDYD